MKQDIIKKALEQEAINREEEAVADAQNIIRKIGAKESQRKALLLEIVELRKELKKLSVETVTAEDVFGS